MTKTLIENSRIKVFVDTNIVVDAFTLRDTNYRPSQQLLRQIAVGNIDAYICTKQITDLYYIFRKYYKTKEEIIKTLKVISQLFKMLPLISGDILYCINSPVKDFEDAILDEVASVNIIPYIITNNIDDYANGKTPVLKPEQLLDLLQLN